MEKKEKKNMLTGDELMRKAELEWALSWDKIYMDEVLLILVGLHVKGFDSFISRPD